jgi:hypothetical protein
MPDEGKIDALSKKKRTDSSPPGLLARVSWKAYIATRCVTILDYHFTYVPI